MKKLNCLILLTVLGLATPAVPAQEAATKAATAPLLKAHPDSKNWEDLFRTDLSNATHPAGVWSCTDGILTATEDQNIWTKADYGDCVLDLEFKLEPGANSGVFVYNSNPKEWMPNSVEIQILDDYSDKWKTVPKTWLCGGFFGHSAPLKQAGKPAGQWNRMTIACQGPHITALLNGELVTDVDLRQWTSSTKNPDGSEIPSWLISTWAKLPQHGRIGLQGRHAGAGIFFRNLKIQQLNSSKP
jgi:hypothetical protein